MGLQRHQQIYSFLALSNTAHSLNKDSLRKAFCTDTYVLILCYATNAKLQAVVQVTEGAEDVTTVGFQLRKMASEWSVPCMGGTLRVVVGRSTIHSFAPGALMWRHAHV